MSRFDPKLPFPLPDANQDARPVPVVAPLSSTLVELNGWWLDISCDCGHTRSSCLPLRRTAGTCIWCWTLGLACKMSSRPSSASRQVNRVRRDAKRHCCLSCVRLRLRLNRTRWGLGGQPNHVTRTSAFAIGAHALFLNRKAGALQALSEGTVGCRSPDR